MASFFNRIKKLENRAHKKNQATDAPICISRELYEKLDFVQQLNLPKVRFAEVPEWYAEITEAYFNDEITYAEYEELQDELSESDEISDAELQKCIEKHGGLSYNWTPERLAMLKAGTVPTD